MRSKLYIVPWLSSLSSQQSLPFWGGPINTRNTEFRHTPCQSPEFWIHPAYNQSRWTFCSPSTYFHCLAHSSSLFLNVVCRTPGSTRLETAPPVSCLPVPPGTQPEELTSILLSEHSGPQIFLHFTESYQHQEYLANTMNHLIPKM